MAGWGLNFRSVVKVQSGERPGLMYEFENCCAEVEGSAVPPEWPQGLNKAFLPRLGMRVDPHKQSQRDLTEK